MLPTSIINTWTRLVLFRIGGEKGMPIFNCYWILHSFVRSYVCHIINYFDWTEPKLLPNLLIHADAINPHSCLTWRIFPGKRTCPKAPSVVWGVQLQKAFVFTPSSRLYNAMISSMFLAKKKRISTLLFLREKLFTLYYNGMVSLHWTLGENSSWSFCLHTKLLRFLSWKKKSN